MDSKTALDKIKEAEQKASDIIEDARRQAVVVLETARVKKEAIIKKAKRDAMDEAAKLKDNIGRATAAEVAEIEKKAREDIELLDKMLKANFDKAVAFLRSKIEL
jgi:V/A-type H+-transporting ATPase subunit G/H